MRSTFYSLLAVLFVAVSARGQVYLPAGRADEGGRVAVAIDSVPRTIAEAEALAGKPERRCVNINGSPTSRSGDFSVMGFATYNEVWRRGYGKLAWDLFPAAPPGPDSVTIRTTRLEPAGEWRVFKFEVNHRANGGVFYPSGVHVPSTGKWMFLVTAGEYWGCFVYNLYDLK